MLTFLQGYKTYIIALIAVIYAGSQYWAGSIDLNQLVAALTAAAGLAGLRAGVVSTVANAVAALHLLNSPNQTVASAKQAAASALAIAKKTAPVIALCIGVLLVAPALVACSTLGGSSPKTTLAAAEVTFGQAQSWWITNCINQQAFAFCTDPATRARVKATSQATTDAFSTATDAITANTLDPATIAQLVTDANADAASFAALIATFKSPH